MFKVNNKNTRTKSMKSLWCFYSIFITSFFIVSIVDFEQVTLSWVRSYFTVKMPDLLEVINMIHKEFKKDSSGKTFAT